MMMAESDADYQMRMMKYQAYVAGTVISLPGLFTSSGGKLVLHVADIAEMASDMALDQYENDIKAEVSGGAQIVSALRTLQVCYGAGRLSGLAKNGVQYLASNADNILAELEKLKIKNINAYNKIKAIVLKLIGAQGAGNAISKLDNILAKQGFSGTNGLFNKLKSLESTPRRTANYASLQSFRDEFIRCMD